MHSTTSLDLVIIVGAIAVGSFVKGATGGGLPQVAIPVMAVFLGAERAVIIMAIPGVVSNAVLVWTHRDAFKDTRDLGRLLSSAVLGAVAGTVLLTSVNGRILAGILVGVIVLYIAVALLHPGFVLPPRITKAVSPPVGLAAGGLQGATGISGPLLTTYLHSFGLVPRAFVLSLSALFCVSAIVQVVTLTGVGLYNQTMLVESVAALVPTVAFLPLGSRAARRLSPRTFRRVTLVLVAASGLSLLRIALVGGGQ